jgi:glutamate--cysteine ligase catalytic subunit
MGLLSLGTPLSWEEAVKLADHVRSEGIKQFINAYKKGQNHNPNFWTWGDDVGMLIFYHYKLIITID